MGKTVPSYRMAIECEIANWKAFRDALSSEDEKQAFDIIMDLCRIQAWAAQQKMLMYYSQIAIRFMTNQNHNKIFYT